MNMVFLNLNIFYSDPNYCFCEQQLALPKALKRKTKLEGLQLVVKQKCFFHGNSDASVLETIKLSHVRNTLLPQVRVHIARGFLDGREMMTSMTCLIIIILIIMILVDFKNP